MNNGIDGSPSAVGPGGASGPLLATVVAGGMERVLGLARKHLGMDGAFVAEFIDGKQVYRALDGDAAGFGFALGDGPPLEQTYCRLMTAGEIPNVVADARGHDTVGALAITREAGIGSYVGVPIRLADGTLYGSLCCLSHDSAPVDDRDAKFLFLLADLVAVEAEADRSRAGLRARIAELIDTDRIQTALQPIVNITTGRVVGVEALARFESGPPNLVFEQAHTVGLREKLEQLALHHAWQVLPLLPRECYLAVNLSPDVADRLAGFTATDQLDRLGIGLDRVVLEITEHAAVASYETLRQGLAAARARGLRLAIDDAGAGFASLHHIAELRPDIIKIDRSLTHRMSTDRGRRSVVRALVALAEDLGATTVAEGIEEPPDLEVAHDLGIHAVQGYLFARPSTDREDLRAWLTRRFTLPWAQADRVLPPAPWRLAAPPRSGVPPRPGLIPGSSPP